MKEILTQLIAASIDKEMIPSLDFFDMHGRPDGYFEIQLTDGTRIRVSVENVTNE